MMRRTTSWSMTGIVVGDSLRIVQPHGQHRLCALQHQRVLRRIQVQPNDISYLLDEQRIGGQLVNFSCCP